MRKDNQLNSNREIKKRFSYSFSLIEVIIFVSILGLFFIFAATVATSSLRDMQINEHKIIATHYAEQMLEWLKAKKMIDWDHISMSMSSNGGSTYCFNQTLFTDIATFPTPTEGWQNTCASTLSPFFKREVTLTRDTTGCGGTYVCKVKVVIKVKWQEHGNNYEVPINTVFSIWE